MAGPAPATPLPADLCAQQGLQASTAPPRRAGIVYQRHIPWLDRTLSFKTVDIEQDLERLNRWMNDSVVAASWREEGEPAKHRAYLQALSADPHLTALIANFDGEDFGYFEVYWATEDRIARFYDVDDFDRGWLVLIGGKPFVTAWMPSISHYLFLDSRIQRVVIEPRSDNYKMLRNLGKCGYAHLKEFDFPHKRATLGMLLREPFFAEWLRVPRDAVATSYSTSLS